MHMKKRVMIHLVLPRYWRATEIQRGEKLSDLKGGATTQGCAAEYFRYGNKSKRFHWNYGAKHRSNEIQC